MQLLLSREIPKTAATVKSGVAIQVLMAKAITTAMRGPSRSSVEVTLWKFYIKIYWLLTDTI